MVVIFLTVLPRPLVIEAGENHNYTTFLAFTSYVLMYGMSVDDRAVGVLVGDAMSFPALRARLGWYVGARSRKS